MKLKKLKPQFESSTEFFGQLEGAMFVDAGFQDAELDDTVENSVYVYMVGTRNLDSRYETTVFEISRSSRHYTQQLGEFTHNYYAPVVEV